MIKRDFLNVFDFTKEEILAILKRAAELKLNPASTPSVLKDKIVGMLFDKSSTRTRVSFEVGILQLGGNSIFLTSAGMQLGRGETVHDTARVLSRYLDAIVIRTYAHEIIEEFATHASIPIINALTDLHHPCQALADMLTIYEKKQTYNLKMAYLGDGNNVAHSLIQVASRLGTELVIACPEGYAPDAQLLEDAIAESSAGIRVLTDPAEAARDADVLYTDTWVSMGQEDKTKDRDILFRDFQVNDHLLKAAKPDSIVMHCLPAHRGHEITDSVMDGPHSVVFDQAENRLHSQKAVLEFLLPG